MDAFIDGFAAEYDDDLMLTLPCRVLVNAVCLS